MVGNWRESLSFCYKCHLMEKITENHRVTVHGGAETGCILHHWFDV